ncbi:hypothetical protein [Amycolatopsis panacis]|uniref:LPXTG cell wall anchor domain-containing protein n=1 Tax=Amycolatopsis panacis TaxID=2340917 RepID=A0A419I1X7_9PSEU|nr:hypothetical protein [Amycolatopsis panacis]RJQ83776.1 hypothetical protein D5S19_19145 [Amycolatopsis panacis]
MAKVRGLLLAGLLGVLLTGVLAVSPASATTPAPTVAITQVSELHQAPPGPVLDPTETDKANTEKSKSKLVAGGAAVALLAIVFFGRRHRIKRRKAGG